MARTVGQVSEEALKIEAFLVGQPHGVELAFADIEENAGVAMNARGRAYLRTALKRQRREYSPIKGWGIKLASAATCMPILSSRIRRINGAVRTADKTQKLLQQEFFQSLPVEVQKEILFAGAVFGAIRLAAEQGHFLFRKKPKGELDKGPTITIPLPEVG